MARVVVSRFCMNDRRWRLQDLIRHSILLLRVAAIKPLLHQKFPGAADADLERARAFAYGGCVIQDLGYYPFGNRFFSNLTHYVRSGDFVEALIRDAKDVDELAFAL